MKKASNIGGIALMMGTVIGAGIFGVPYALQQFGFMLGMVLLVILGYVVVATTMAYADLILHAGGEKQFIGVIEKYLGRPGRVVAIFALILGMTGGLLAYLIEIGNQISLFLSPWISVDAKITSLIFFVLAGALITLGLGSVTRTEIVMVVIIVVIIALLTIFSIPHLQFEHFFNIDVLRIGLPYGVLLFALPGFTVVPSLIQVTGNNKKSIRKSISCGTIIPAILFGVFAFTIIGVCGAGTTESAIQGLGDIMGSGFLVAGSLLGILTIGTSFLVFGLVLSEVYQVDLKVPRYLSLFLALLPPLMVFLVDKLSFITILAIVGSVITGTQATLILLSWLKVSKHKKKSLILQTPRIIIYFMMLVFFVGAGYGLYTSLA